MQEEILTFSIRPKSARRIPYIPSQTEEGKKKSVHFQSDQRVSEKNFTFTDSPVLIFSARPNYIGRNPYTVNLIKQRNNMKRSLLSTRPVSMSRNLSEHCQPDQRM